MNTNGFLRLGLTCMAAALLFAPHAMAQTAPRDGENQVAAELPPPAEPAEEGAQDDDAMPPEATHETAPPPESGSPDEAPLPTAPADQHAPGTDDRTMSHQLQVGVRVGFGFSYLFAIKYGDGAACSTSPDEETFCRHLVGGLIDVELGFGITEGLELSFDGRFGLADDPNAHHVPVQLGLGIRGYIPATDPFKLYIGARLTLDLTESNDPAWKDVDVGARAEFGLQYDILRYLGVYIQLGVNIQILRAFAFPLDFTGGVQARFP